MGSETQADDPPGWSQVPDDAEPGANDPAEPEDPVQGDEVSRLRILIHDQPTPDVDEVWITVDEVSVHGSAQGWIVIDDSVQSFDLLALQDGVVEELALAVLDPGSYQQIRLRVLDSWVVVGGDSHPLDIPSAAQSGIKLIHGFELPECGTLTLSLDWDVGAHLRQNPQGYRLRPTLFVDSETLIEDCDPDQDGDGVPESGDCDDTDPAVGPFATEVPYDCIDNDCDPSTSDQPSPCGTMVISGLSVQSAFNGSYVLNPGVTQSCQSVWEMGDATLAYGTIDAGYWEITATAPGRPALCLGALEAGPAGCTDWREWAGSSLGFIPAPVVITCL
jgi:hypothetical protein